MSGRKNGRTEERKNRRTGVCVADLTRREFGTVTAAAVGTLALGGAPAAAAPLKGRLKQSVCRWCYGKIPLPEFFKTVAEMGLTAVDLLGEADWTIAKRDFGLVCSMGQAPGNSIPDGLNDPAHHAAILDGLAKTLPKAARDGVPNVITFFGNRRGMPLEQGIANSVTCLQQAAKMAEAEGVTVCVELLNSKVDHKDYIGDHTAYGAEIVRRVGSPRVKLLYDIYHMQIMEGDVIRTIGDNWEAIGHFHTGGVPGRHELDDTQELQWASIARAIADKGYTGYFAHEFIPTRDPFTSLREAVALCDV
jgi:hydroxypyruvate isomerase